MVKKSNKNFKKNNISKRNNIYKFIDKTSKKLLK